MKKLIGFPAILIILVSSFAIAAGEKNADTDALSNKALAALSSEDIDKSSSEAIDGMRGTLSSTQELLQKAREEKEGILAVNCINQQMAAMKGFVKVSEQQAAIISKNEDRKIQENSFRLINISSERVDALYEDALNCTGETARFAKDTKINRRTPDIADVEVIEIDDDKFDDRFAKERVPELTPYQ